MKFIVITIVVGALFLAGVGAWMIRTVKHTPIERWHVDPLTAPNPGTPNFYRVGPPTGTEGQDAPVDAPAPVYAATAPALATALDDFALRQRDTIRIAGQPGDLWMTYVQRTEVMRFPDYVSVRIVPLPDGRATLSIFSRSRYGYGDMGVNRARVEAWLAGLRSLETSGGTLAPVQP